VTVLATALTSPRLFALKIREIAAAKADIKPNCPAFFATCAWLSAGVHDATDHSNQAEAA